MTHTRERENKKLFQSRDECDQGEEEQNEGN